MESFPLFFRVRVIAFTFIMLLSFLWLVLLCVETFARWDVADQISRSLMILFILTNSITLILLPILMLVEFRAWLDAARLLLLFVFQAGSAAAGTYWSPRIQCPDQNPDDIGVCQLIGVYTMIACWVIPAILMFYSTYFVILVYLQSRIPVVVKPKHHSGADPEAGSFDSVFLWQDKVGVANGSQSSGLDSGVSPRSLFPPSTARPSSQPHSSMRWEPIVHRYQSTMPSTIASPSMLASSVPSRHHSLPAPNALEFRSLSVPHPILNNISLPQSQTPSSYTHSVSPVMKVRFADDDRWKSRRSSIVPSSSSPSTELGSSMIPSSSRARLSKPVPSHVM